MAQRLRQFLPTPRLAEAFEVKVPAAPLPQLLVVAHPKDHPLPPIYAKVTAEWQVDHWRFEPVEGNTSNGLLNAGKLRSEFTGATMVKGSPEAEKAFREVRDAINQARKEIGAIRGRYTEQVVSGAKPGTVYTGKVSYGSNVAPCELRFLDPSPGADTRFANFQITLSGPEPVMLVCLQSARDHRATHPRAGHTTIVRRPKFCLRLRSVL